MKRAIGHAALSVSLLRRLSVFDMADFGPHTNLLYRELTASASAGLPASTIILAAAIVDIVQHEQAGPAGYLDGSAFAYAGSTANLGWLRNHRPFGITSKPAASIRLAHQTVTWPFMVKQIIAPPAKPAKVGRAASIGKCRPIKIAGRASLFMLDNINNGRGKDDRAC